MDQERGTNDGKSHQRDPRHPPQLIANQSGTSYAQKLLQEVKRLKNEVATLEGFSLLEFIRHKITRAIHAIWDKADEKELSKTEKTTAKKLWKELSEAKEYLRALLFKKRVKEIPPKWLTGSKVWQKKLKHTYFWAFHCYAMENALPPGPETWGIINKAGGYTWEDYLPKNPKNYQPEDLVFILDRAHAAKELGMSPSLPSKYCDANFRCGIWECLPKKLGRGGNWVYVIGKRRVWFDRENREWKTRVDPLLIGDKLSKLELYNL